MQVPRVQFAELVSTIASVLNGINLTLLARLISVTKYIKLTGRIKLDNWEGGGADIHIYVFTVEIIDIECVLGHESCLHLFSQVPF